MLKLGLLGYGKMGKAIEQIAENESIDIVWRIRRENAHELSLDLLRAADVVIEFSRPEAAYDNVMACLEAKVPVVSGTTGWGDDLAKAQAFCQKNGGALLWASNFSIGVNLFFALNRYLANLMGDRSEYQPAITETHHRHKLDAPSGTALTLANTLIASVPRLLNYQLQAENKDLDHSETTIPIWALREGEVPGTHLIRWQSDVDEISIEHRAHSRAGFAQGRQKSPCLRADFCLHCKHVREVGGQTTFNFSNIDYAPEQIFHGHGESAERGRYVDSCTLRRRDRLPSRQVSATQQHDNNSEAPHRCPSD